MRFVLVLVVVAACYSPGYQDCEITCASGSCPAGLTCSSGVCRAPGMTGACNVQPGEDANTGDSSMDGTDAAPLGPWSAPMRVDLQPQSGFSGDRQPTLSNDLLELYLIRNNQIHRARRTGPSAPWSTVEQDLSLSMSTADIDDSPALAGNGLVMYFASRRQPSLDFDLWFATRPIPGAQWDPPRHITELSLSGADRGVAATNDDLTLVFHTGDATTQQHRILISERTPGSPWDQPTDVQELAVVPGMNPQDPMLSTDKLTIYFHATDPNGGAELYEATRPSLDQPFGTPTPIMELNSIRRDESPWISPDGRQMFFASDRDGIMQIWESRR